MFQILESEKDGNGLVTYGIFFLDKVRTFYYHNGNGDLFQICNYLNFLAENDETSKYI